jgi:hypothetical protein
MAGAVYFVLEGIPAFVWISGMVSEIIQLCAAVGAGGLVFFLLTYLFRMEELKIILSVLRGKK